MVSKWSVSYFESRGDVGRLRVTVVDERVQVSRGVAVWAYVWHLLSINHIHSTPVCVCITCIVLLSINHIHSTPVCVCITCIVLLSINHIHSTRVCVCIACMVLLSINHIHSTPVCVCSTCIVLLHSENVKKLLIITIKAKKRIDFKFAILVFKCVHGSAPPYLIEELIRPADSLARCRLCSASSSILVVRRTRLTTVGDRSIPVTASRVWNNLPQHVITSPSLRVFKNRLKTHLFSFSFP